MARSAIDNAIIVARRRHPRPTWNENLGATQPTVASPRVSPWARLGEPARLPAAEKPVDHYHSYPIPATYNKPEPHPIPSVRVHKKKASRI